MVIRSIRPIGSASESAGPAPAHVVRVITPEGRPCDARPCTAFQRSRAALAARDSSAATAGLGAVEGYPPGAGTYGRESPATSVWRRDAHPARARPPSAALTSLSDCRRVSGESCESEGPRSGVSCVNMGEIFQQNRVDAQQSQTVSDSSRFRRLNRSPTHNCSSIFPPAQPAPDVGCASHRPVLIYATYAGRRLSVAAGEGNDHAALG